MQRSAAGGRPLQQPLPVAFDVPPLELGDAGHGRVLGGNQQGELPQRQLCVLHGARPQCPGDLPQVVLHRFRHSGRVPGPLLGSDVGPVRGTAAGKLVGQLAVEQCRFKVEQGGGQGLDAAVGDAAGRLQQQAAPLVPVNPLQLVRPFREQRDEVAQQVELGHRHRVAEAERVGGLHEPQMQFRLRSRKHDAQSRTAGDKIIGAGPHPSGHRQPADEPVGLVVESELPVQRQPAEVSQVGHCGEQGTGSPADLVVGVHALRGPVGEVVRDEVRAHDRQGRGAGPAHQLSARSASMAALACRYCSTSQLFARWM
ncbi:hypothetical protein [Streptomyces deccanensis]|uniref:hypothetical protein n=1 Tax=Streptomyces deccanensis TaxID=424188 RepID=UPI001EFB15BA|nr:hypothetical protein [Streptomyces deccanensis]ULR54411.1 hypothetical protein L3078_36855 [Streptomyces deccanensis]